jgi:predicted AlkP superfamily pyrophosphatase or phosphodiesterase
MRYLHFILFFSLCYVSNCLFEWLWKKKEPKKRVLLIGIDGLMQDCLNESTNREIWDFMKQRGSYTFKARTAIQSMSASGWSNILCGMPTEDSGVTFNHWVPTNFFQRLNRIQVISDDGLLPCIFQEIKKQDKNLVNYSVYNWDWFIFLGDTINPKTVDKDIFIMADNYNQSRIGDEKVANKTLEIINEDFSFFFLYFGSVDTYGHTHGFCSKEYIEQLSIVNQHIHKIFLKMIEGNTLDNTYVILTTDHGATFMKGHGDINDSNLIIPWLIIGPGIKKNYEINSNVKLIDTSPTVMKILKLQPNQFWRGQALEEIFENN